MVIHSACGRSIFAARILRPLLTFDMDLDIGDKVFYTRSTGFRVPTKVVGHSDVPTMFGRAPKQPLRMTRKMMLGRRLIYVHCAVKSTLRQNVVNVI